MIPNTCTNVPLTWPGGKSECNSVPAHRGVCVCARVCDEQETTDRIKHPFYYLFSAEAPTIRDGFF